MSGSNKNNKQLRGKMKKNLLVFTVLISMFSVVNISQASAESGGYAVVNPETGTVHGVIVATSSDPFENGGTMPMEYMGCPVGCIIVQQSTADQNGNVAGKFSHGETQVIYNSNNNMFEVTESNTTQSQTVTESASNTSAIETEVSVSRSVRNYEFGVQDFTNTNGEFQMTEVAPAQNTNAQASTITKQFTCEESGFVCSQRMSNALTILGEETILFSERKTSQQVLAQAVAEARTKIQEQINLILSMLGRWTLN